MRWTNGDFLLQWPLLKEVEGAFLQGVRTYAQALELSFWQESQGKITWYFDLDPRRPGYYRMPLKKNSLTKPARKPLELFLSSHFKNKKLNEVAHIHEYGRVLWLIFSDEAKLELRLFPHGTNAVATADGKSLYFRKPANLIKLSEFHKEPPAFRDKMSDEAIWESFFAKSNLQKPKKTSKDQLEKLLSIKNKVEKDSGKDQGKNWRILAEKLQSDPSSEIWPDSSQSLQWNINFCFQKMKQEKEKSNRRRKRLQEINEQIKALQCGEGQKSSAPSQKGREDLFSKSNSRGQSVILPSGHKMYFGKNAADNLKLLRASSAWDLWFHIRDLPGSHGILLKNKQEKLPEDILASAGYEFLKFSFRRHPEKYYGQKFDLLITELRYVKPIKGDKLGRVNYSNARTLRIEFKE